VESLLTYLAAFFWRVHSPDQHWGFDVATAGNEQIHGGECSDLFPRQSERPFLYLLLHGV
jgi:hypothetical protein